MAGKIFSAVLDAALFIRDGMNGPADIQLAPIGRDGRFGLRLELNEHVAKSLVRSRILLIADPKGAFVELDVFHLDVAEEHGPEAAVADRQRLSIPIHRRF